MRRTIICCLSLALWFTLTSLLLPSTAHAGDLPPGCCEYFSEANFAPLEPGKLVLPKVDFVSAAAVTSKATKISPQLAPVLLAYIPKSVRTWDFDYEPSSAVAVDPIKRPRIKLLWHTQKVSFRLMPTLTVPVRSQKKHIAPVLFWGTGSATDMTFAVKLISHQVGRIVYSGFSPTPQFPFRVVRMMNRCF